MKLRHDIENTITKLFETSGRAVETTVICNMVAHPSAEGRIDVRRELDSMVRDGVLEMVASGNGYAYLPAGEEDVSGREAMS